MMNKKVLGGDQGKAPMEQPPLLTQLSPMKEKTPPLLMRWKEQMMNKEMTIEEHIRGREMTIYKNHGRG